VCILGAVTAGLALAVWALTEVAARARVRRLDARHAVCERACAGAGD
jgi:hypothetical protein